MPNFRHLITIVKCFLTLLSIKYWRYVISFFRDAQFCSSDQKFNHLEPFHWWITLYRPVITKWLISDMRNIIIQIDFFLPLLSKYREGWLELHIKILFQVPLCCFYSFSPFRLLSRNTCICSKCLSLYTFTMMVREIGRSISPGKNHISRGLRRPEGNMTFLGV